MTKIRALKHRTIRLMRGRNRAWIILQNIKKRTINDQDSPMTPERLAAVEAARKRLGAMIRRQTQAIIDKHKNLGEQE